MVQVPPPPSPTSQERLLGTLIVIVLRAKNLPNRVRIGKQNPYCTITYGLHKKRTDTIERGGQQPEWDAEFRFEILKDGLGGEEQLAAEQAAIVTHKGGVLPAPAMAPSTSQGSDVSSTTQLEKRTSKHSLGTPVISTCNAGRRVLKVACWADDARDPKLIGEGELDIEETIRKGKFDDWVQLERKARYAGEVYLELTWYSNEPRKATTQRRSSHRSPSRAGAAYGGAGSRVDDRSSSDTGTEEWEADAPAHPVQATGAKAQPVHSVHTSAPTELAADYPDPDVAPLTSSISTMSLARPPLPVPPLAQPQAPPLSANSAASFASFQPSHPGPPTEQHQYPYGIYGYDGRRMSQPAYGNSTYPQTGPPPPPASVMPQQPYQPRAGPTASEFGYYAPPPPLPPHQPQQPPPPGHTPEFYATHPAPHPGPSPFPQYSSPPPLPDPYAQAASYATLPSHSPYPAPPVPPIPPSGSAYWQHPPPPHQLQQAGPGSIPSTPSYHTLPHSASQPTLFSPPPPPPSLSAHYAPPSANGVFSPPPPPPSLRHDTPSYAHLSSPPPAPPHDPYAYHAQQPVPVAPPVPPASAASSSRPPLPQPPTAPGAQQYQSGPSYSSSYPHP